eukprot:Skav220358  [mRNA]  locus=scaffold609:58746:60963:+ [translate_table: standard]
MIRSLRQLVRSVFEAWAGQTEPLWILVTAENPGEASQDLLRTDSLLELGRFWFPALEFLYSDPDFENSPISADVRIARAGRAGISARAKLAGSVRFVVKSPRLPARITTQVYVCLRAPEHPHGFFTRCYVSYRRAVPMASRPVKQGLTEAYIREQLQLAAEPGKPLFQVWLEGPPSAEGGSVAWRASAYLLRWRAGGFMVVLPLTEDIVAFVANIVDAEGVSLVATFEAPVLCETPRGRPLETQVVLLADFPWPCASHFKKAAAIRFTGIPLVRFLDGTAVVRPQQASSWEASEDWIGKTDVEEPFLEEYATAAEENLVEAEDEVEMLEDPMQPPGADQSELIRQQTETIRQMQARLVEPPLVPERQELTAQAESRQLPPRSPQVPKFLEQEVAAEAVDTDELGMLMEAMTDPVHKLMALQLRQNQEMLSRMAARLKQLEDSALVAKHTMRNAMKDMGVLEPYPGLMRDFIERRVPLGDMRLLTMFAYFQAFTWEAAFLARNELMMGYAARGLLFIEQCAADAGKTQMGWLLSGFPDPNFAMVAQNKKQSKIQPYGKSAQPSWIAANVAFVKDMDFLETRLRHSSAKNNNKDGEGDEDKADKTTPKKPWPKRKAKNQADKGADSSAT